jgi:hypothetical protein
VSCSYGPLSDELSLTRRAKANKPQKEIHIHETQSDINNAKSEFKQTEHGALWASVTQSLEDKW